MILTGSVDPITKQFESGSDFFIMKQRYKIQGFTNRTAGAIDLVYYLLYYLLIPYDTLGDLMPNYNPNYRFRLLLIGGLSGALIVASVGACYLGYHYYILAKFDTANTHYANKAYLLAAENYLDVLDSLITVEEQQSAADQLTTILRVVTTQAEMQTFISNNPTIHPYFIEIMSRWRSESQGPQQAREALTYFSRSNHVDSRASLRLVNYLHTRLPALNTTNTHARAWTITIKGIADIAADPQGNLWALATYPSRILRLDDFGHINREIPFILPKEQLTNQDVNFNAMADGGFIIARTKFNRNGIETTYLPFDDRLKDITRSGQQQLLVLHNDGISAYDATFAPRWEKIAHGSKPESFNTTTAIASNDKYIVVLSWYRLQVFNLAGELQSYVDGKFSWAWDVTIDDNDFIYLGSVNNKRIDIYNQQLEKTSTLKTGGDHLAVAGNNILYSIDGNRLTAHYPVPHVASQVVTKAAPDIVTQAPATPPSSEPIPKPDDTRQISFKLTRTDSYPHITVHSNTDWILDKAYTDAKDQGEAATIWLGTQGGLVSYQYSNNQWRKWTVAEGLPEAQVRRIIADDRYLWMINGYHFIRFNLGDNTVENIEPTSRRSFGIRDIIPDKNNTDWLWLLEQDKVIRYSKSRHTGETMATLTSGVSIRQIDNGDIVINESYTQLLQLNPDTKAITTLVNIEDIIALTSRSPRMRRDTWFGEITVDEQRRGLWIGMYYDHNLFFYDYASNTLTAVTIDRSIIASCQRGAVKIELVAGQPYYLGQQCVAKLSNDGKTWQLITQHPQLTRGSLFRVTADSPLWFAAYNGLFSIGLFNIDLSGNDLPSNQLPNANNENTVVAHQPPWDKISSFTQDLLTINGNLWVGASGEPVRIFDTQKRRWNAIPNVIGSKLRSLNKSNNMSNTKRLNKSHENGNNPNNAVVAISNRQLYAIDPNDLTVTKLHLGKNSGNKTGGQHWTSLNDLAFDGNTWWAVGGQDGRDSTGLRAWNGVKEQRWTRAEGMPFGEINQILLDPYETDYIWLASNDGLARFSKSNQTAEVIRSGYVSHIERHENTLYAIAGNQLFIWDCESGQSRDIKITSDTPLEQVPDRLKWHFYHALSTELKSLLKIYPGYVHDTAITGEEGNQTLWLSTHHGILEMKLPATGSDNSQ